MANRERELEAQRVVYIKSDLYPDGEFVPELEARLSVFDRGYTIGDSVYEYGAPTVTRRSRSRSTWTGCLHRSRRSG